MIGFYERGGRGRYPRVLDEDVQERPPLQRGAAALGEVVKTPVAARRLRRKRRPRLRPRREVHLFKVAGEATVIRVNGRRRREGPV